jgi:hypothetical protein
MNLHVERGWCAVSPCLSNLKPKIAITDQGFSSSGKSLREEGYRVRANILHRAFMNALLACSHNIDLLKAFHSTTNHPCCASGLLMRAPMYAYQHLALLDTNWLARVCPDGTRSQACRGLGALAGHTMPTQIYALAPSPLSFEEDSHHDHL